MTSDKYHIGQVLINKFLVDEFEQLFLLDVNPSEHKYSSELIWTILRIYNKKSELVHYGEGYLTRRFVVVELR